LNTVFKERSVWSFYPVLLFVLLVVLLLYLFLFVPVTITLDGYSHLYGSQALRLMLGGQPEFHRTFSYNSILVPNWLSTLFLAALSIIVPNELALKLLMVLSVTALIYSLYFCIDTTLYNYRQRAQALIVLLPFALNAFLTFGFYNFLISSSICIFVLGLVLRHGLRMSLPLQCVTACLLLVAYFSHPFPVIISFLFPGAYIIVDVIIHWHCRWRTPVTALKRHGLGIWPWLPPACIFPWFYLRLSKAVPSDVDPMKLTGVRRALALARHDSITYTLTHRTLELTRDAVVSIAPTANVGTLFIALLSILLAGVFLWPRKLFAQNRLGLTSLTVLTVSTTVLSLIVPLEVGDGGYIVTRILWFAAIFLVLLALASGAFDAQLLTLCSLVAAISVVEFAGEYLLVSKRLAPAVAEVRLAMESVPRHSRILIMGYRMTPSSCEGLPLVRMSVPERSWALVGALRNELIVLNYYEAYTSHFPLRYLTSRYADVVGEVDLSDEQNKAAWSDTLRSDPDVDFVVSWGISRGISANCTNSVDPPFEEALRSRYDVVFSQQGTSRVELWRKRE
jgi:hypothetical protein